MPSKTTPTLGPDALIELLHEQFPHMLPGVFTVLEVQSRLLRLKQRIEPRNLRPGGTISGPTLMGLADIATYLLLLAELGRDLVAVTTSLNIHFLRRPAAVDLVTEARILRLGKRLAVVSVVAMSEGDPEAVAHATVSYAIVSTDAASKASAP